MIELAFENTNLNIEEAREHAADLACLITVASFDTMQFMITADRQKAACTRYRLRVHDYHRMGEAGILTEDDRVELIDGDLIEMHPSGADTPNVSTASMPCSANNYMGSIAYGCRTPLSLGSTGNPNPTSLSSKTVATRRHTRRQRTFDCSLRSRIPLLLMTVTLSCPFMPGIGSMRFGSLRSRPNQSRFIENPPGKDTDISCGPLAMR